MPADAPKAQLYHMQEDIGETDNRYLTEPTIADRLLEQLQQDIRHGRSTDGPKSANDTKKIDLWKSEKR